MVATQCQGTVLVFEKMFENRLFWVDGLIRMGARVVLCDLHRAIVVGPAQLNASYIVTPDIRALDSFDFFGRYHRLLAGGVTMGPGSLTFLTKSGPRFRGDRDLEETRVRDDSMKS